MSGLALQDKPNRNNVHHDLQAMSFQALSPGCPVTQASPTCSPAQ